jgi:hypothetical protein
MSSAIKLFRGLLIASIATGLLGSMIDQQFTALIPPTVLKAVKDLPEPSDSTVVLSSLLVLITFGGIVGSIVGLFQFKPWSRGLAVAMTLLQLLFYPIGGVWVQSGWSALFLDLSSTLWGAVLAISYVSSISKLFEPRRPIEP